MSFNVTTILSEMDGILHGTTVNQVTNIYGVINRAARQLLLDIDPQETKRIAELTNPIYNSVYDYAVPTDLKGNKVIDLRPQVNRNQRDRYTQTYNKDFDVYKEWNLSPNFTIQSNTGVKIVRIDNQLLPNGAVINSATSVSGNGTWAADGTWATDLTGDEVNYVAGSSSLTFNLNAGGSTGYLQNSTMTEMDLTDYKNQSTIFYYVYLPSATNFTSLNLRWGSSTTAYWTATSTTDWFGNAFVNGWNLIGVTWSAATSSSGTPDMTKVNFLRVSYNYDGTAVANCKLNSITDKLGTILEIEYYSKYLFKDYSTSAWKETVTADSDIINLDTESYNILLYQIALLCAQQLIDSGNATYDTTFFQQKYNEAITRYKAMYKSEVTIPRLNYYKLPYNNYRRYFGRNYNY